MGFNSFCRGALFGFLVSLLFAGTFSLADDKTVKVVGRGECADCKEKNIQSSHAFSGLHVAIYCKNKGGKFEQKGDVELDEEGNFKVELPKEALDSEDHNKECYAQLQSASSAPCPAHKGLESARIIAKFDASGKHTFEPTEVLTFFSELCTSTTLWSRYKYPPLSGIDLFKHHFEKHFKAPPQVKKPDPDSEPKKPQKPSDPKKQKPQLPKKPLIPSDPKKQKPVTKSPSEKSPVTKPPSENPPLKKPCPFPDFPKINFPKFPSQYFHAFKLPGFSPLPPNFLHP